jgi:integrating conjugative element protein (TIGR03758 family)
MLALLSAAPASAQQLGPKVVATAAQVAAAIGNSPLGSGLKAYAADIGKLAINVESGGNLGIYNGSCCTGVLQVNKGGLAKYCDCTSEEYANMPLQQQVDVWAKLTNANTNNATVQGLMGMGSFGGQPVTGAMVLSCIQIGPGNCAKTIKAGTCATSAGSDGNGNNFCDFAAKINGVSGSNPAAISDINTPSGAAPPLLPSANYQYPSAEDAFLAGAGVDVSQSKDLVLSALSVVMFLWTASVALAQYGSWRQGRIDWMTLQTNIIGSTVLTLLVLGLTLA